MISELHIDNPDNTCIPWWNEVKWLKGREHIEFKPGLNILWGPNGSGKSTILLCLARMLHAEAGNSTTVTGNSIREVFEMFSRDGSDGFKCGAMPVHDGQAVMHFDPMHAVGLAFGGGAFDWDFGMEGIANTMFKGSSGQTTLNRLGAILEAIIRGKWPDIVWHHQVPKPKNTKTKPSDLWAARSWIVNESLKGTVPIGPRTILLDEPDRSLDLPYQWGLWNRLVGEKGIQFIIASHSLMALGIPGANYIELGDGDYLRKSEWVLDRLVERHLDTLEGISPSAKADLLLELLKRSTIPGKPQRDPRADPCVGDIVRITKKDGSYELRKVRKIARDPDDPDRSWLWWVDADTEKGGSKMFIGSWKKVCKDALVIYREQGSNEATSA